MSFNISQKGLVLISVPLAFGLAFVTILLLSLDRAERAADEWEHSQKVIGTADQLIKHFYDASTNLFGYKFTHDHGLMIRFESARDEISQEVDDLTRLVGTNPYQQESLRRIRILAPDGVELLDGLKKDIESNGGTIALINLGDTRKRIKAFADQLKEEVEKLVAVELKKQSEKDKLQTRGWVRNLLAVGVAANIIIAVLLAIFFSRGIARRLHSVRENTGKLAAGQSLNPVVSGTDEIAELDQVFHRMAEQLVEAARKERAIVDNALDVIFAIDDSNRFVKANQASLEAWGYSAESLAGKPFQDIVYAGDLAKATTTLTELKAGKDADSLELRIIRPDGGTAYSLWTMRWSASEQQLFCVAHDISDRKEVERLKQDFLNMVSHDLRTPLFGLQITLENTTTGAYGDLNERGQMRLKNSQKSLNQLLGLVDGLLQLEKLESGSIEINPTRISLLGTIKHSAESVRLVAEANGLSLTLPDQDFEIFADEMRISQVIINFLSNAIKFSPAGSCIEIGVEEHPEHVKVLVMDQGRGIPAQYLDAVFDRFKQVERADATEKKGTGLGLAICKVIIEQHGGKIGVTSQEGKGSTFWFLLPRTHQ